MREIMQEHERQDEKWGEQNHPMLSTAFPRDKIVNMRNAYQQVNDEKTKKCWFSIFMEKILEVSIETDPIKQREEMIQVAAVAVQIIERLDRRIEEANREKGD
jgi:hypothetical protein